MISKSDIPEEKLWVKVGEDRRIHPYGAYKRLNRDHVEVTNKETDDDGNIVRWVAFSDGEHEAWIQIGAKDEYGYDVQPEERVPEAKREALQLKQTAIRDGSEVAVGEVRDFLETADAEQFPHALVALYYAAKSDPDVPDDDVDTLRELVHEHTSHVDTSHKPTLRRILDETLGDESAEAD